MSWIEVESKIKVSKPDELRKKIKKIARFVKIENKIDDYYALDSAGVYPKKSLRVRDKSKKVEVNFKQPISYENGIWAKRESEFEVSDLKNFFGLLKDFGFKKWLRKEKKTELYKTNDGVNIELNQVKNLGWFLEIEVLAAENEIKEAMKKVENVRRELGLRGEDVEKLGYTKELWAMRHAD